MTQERASSEPIAIIGIGCLFPKADGPGAYWANICNRVDAVGDIPPTHWHSEDYVDRDPKSPDKVYTARGAFLDPVPFPPLEFGITPNALEATDTTQLLGLMVARQALIDAGYAGERNFDRNRVSVILGVTGTLELVIPLGARLGHPIWRRALKEAGVAEDVADRVVQKISDSYVGWQEDSFPGLLGNVAAGRIANRLDLGGTNCVVDAACASSLGAVHLAMLELTSGRADMVVTGGLDTFNDIFMFTCFSKTPALSPTGNARPFDTAADGTILGEGLGVVILKRHADAVRDGDRIYALLRAVGSSSDGKGNAIYAPSPPGQMKALRRAYELAGVAPETIGLVEAHGTGTKAGDAAELTALAEVYRASGREGSWCAIGSVKSQIGHTKAAAGVAGLIKAALALHHKVLPPTIKVQKPNDLVLPGRGPIYVNTEKRPWLPERGHPRRAAVSSFGFGGSNFHAVLEEADGEKRGVFWDGQAQILAFSAPTRPELRAKLTSFPANGSWDEIRRAAAASRESFCPSEHCRLLIVAERDKALLTLIASALGALDRHADRPTWSTPERVYFGSGPAAGKLAFLFPGQGSQSVGMLRDLACQFPQVLASLAEADAESPRERLSDRIYPLPAFDDATRQRQDDELRATDTAQPALGAVSLGALRVLQHFGVQPEVVAGHSYGELVALCAAGRLTSAELHRLSRLRGRLMAAEAKGDRGAMLAVRASLSQVEAVLREERLDLTIANRNAPAQNVLSGERAEIDRAATAFSARNIAARRLPVSAAFHSPLVAAAQSPFLDALATVAFPAGKIPVLANSTGQPYLEDPGACRKLLAGQLAQPVQFVAEIENLYAQGVRTFVEVGPGSVLTGLVGAILEGKGQTALAMDVSAGKRSGQADLAAVLGQLAALGHGVDLKRWDDGPRPAASPKATMTVPICGANYVKPKASTPASAVAKPAAPLPPTRVPESPPPRPAPTMESPRGVPPVPPPSPTPLSAAPVLPARAQTAGVSQETKPMSDRHAASSPPRALNEALQITQDNLVALQRLGEQTAQLHRQFLEGQDRVLNAFQGLLEHQQRLLQASLSGTPRNLAPVASLPAPRVAVAPPPAPIVPAAVVQAPIAPPPPIAAPVIATPSIPTPVATRTPAAAPVAPPAPAPVPASVAPSPGSADLERTLLGVVSEKTGYPPEMLELDMELDSDLGIDSIKRVEIFSALQEKLPEAPAVGPEHLGTLRTLRQVAAFLGANGTQKETPAASASRPVAPVESAPSMAATAGLAQILLSVVSDKTGYPPEMLELDMELDSDLGIDSIKRVEIFSALQERLPEAPTVGPEHLGTLRTLRQVAAFLGGGTASQGAKATEPATVVPVAPPAPAPMPERPLFRYVLKARPLPDDRPTRPLPEGEIWITEDGSPLAGNLAARLSSMGLRSRVIRVAEALATPPSADLGGLILLAPSRGADDAFVRLAFRLIQHAGPVLRQTGGLLTTVSRLDGAFGLDAGAADPISGALAGLVKTAAREWPELHGRAIDLAPDFNDPEEAALALADELAREGPIEIGIGTHGSCDLHLEAAPQVSATARPLAAGEVVVLTGGARGVTAEVAVALARGLQPTLVLLGRSPEPAPEPTWLAALAEEADIKRALMTQANGKATPRDIQEQYQQVLANREIRRTLERITATGARAVYRSADVRDAAAVARLLNEVRQQFGPIRGIIHGAGVLADRRIEEKTEEQFERVYATKVQGLRSLLAAVAADELRFLALFSSSTARFGRIGQIDYAAANEVLNKVAQAEARRRRGCRVVSLNWGPWDGGMVNAALKGVFAKEGVGLIGLAEGAELLVQEVCTSDANAARVEVLVLGSALADMDVTPPAAAIQVATDLTLAFERELSVEEVPVLRAHVLDGRAVLPAALMAEWLAHGALHGNPGLAFHGLDRFRILKGIRLEEDESRRVRVLAGRAIRSEGIYRVPVELHSRGTDGRDLLHGRAEIVLADRLPATPPPAQPSPTGTALPLDDLYDRILFHGPELQAITAIDGCSAEGITAQVSSAPSPSAWVRQPLRTAWLGDPLAVDAAFQLMIVWCVQQRGVPSLPCAVGQYRQYRRTLPRDGLRVVARIHRISGMTVFADLDFLDVEEQVVARLHGYECVMDSALAAAFRRNRLAGAALAT